jgi:AmiR/NasT family two-component response regulator
MAASKPVPGVVDGPLTVLVAEDEALIRMDLVEMLGELGYQVIAQASDGQQAVDLTRALRPDLVFLDVAMPVRDGLSAAEEIAAESLAPVVMVTAFSQRDAVERATAAGVMGYLVKPFSRSDLVPAIEVAFARWTQLIELQDQVSDLQARLVARRAVDLAKSRLQHELAVSEPEAFALLRRRAMDARVTLAEAAVSYLGQTEAADS